MPLTCKDRQQAGSYKQLVIFSLRKDEEIAEDSTQHRSDPPRLGVEIALQLLEQMLQHQQALLR